MVTQKISELIDRLAIEVNKVSFFENQKANEHKKENPDYKLIAESDKKSRFANEERSKTKNLIDLKIKEIIESGEYNVPTESRTF